MSRPPRDPKESIFTRNLTILIASRGLVMTVAMILTFVWKLTEKGGSITDPGNPLIPEAQTLVLCTMVLNELFSVFACRSEVHSFFKLGVFSNRWLIWATMSSLALLFVVLYVPALKGPFHVVSMGPEDWALIVPVSLSGFVTIEIVKWFFRHGRAKQR